MQIMLDDLLSKRDVYLNAKMYESVATLETSINVAEALLEKEKQQIKRAFEFGIADAYNFIEDDAEQYYNQTYNPNK